MIVNGMILHFTQYYNVRRPSIVLRHCIEFLNRYCFIDTRHSQWATEGHRNTSLLLPVSQPLITGHFCIFFFSHDTLLLISIDNNSRPLLHHWLRHYWLPILLHLIQAISLRQCRHRAEDVTWQARWGQAMTLTIAAMIAPGFHWVSLT